MEIAVKYETIQVRDVGSTRMVTLHRPERRNAITPQMQDELLLAMEEAPGVAGCRVLVLAGAGEVFCAGLDLEHLRSAATKSDEAHAEDARRLATLFRLLYELPLPTIALVQGAAVAGGAGLATICDYTIACEDTKLGYPEVRIGFVPALVSAYLTLQIGDRRARRLLLSGRNVGAAEALALGLVSEIVPRERLHARGMELAAELAANSSQAIASTKTLLAEQHRPWLDRATEAAVRTNAGARSTADFHEGIAAFLEKRKPVWPR